MELYYKLLTSYGAVVMIAILRDLEANDLFEECALLESALLKMEVATGQPLPRELNEQVF